MENVKEKNSMENEITSSDILLFGLVIALLDELLVCLLIVVDRMPLFMIVMFMVALMVGIFLLDVKIQGKRNWVKMIFAAGGFWMFIDYIVFAAANPFTTWKATMNTVNYFFPFIVNKAQTVYITDSWMGSQLFHHYFVLIDVLIMMIVTLIGLWIGIHVANKLKKRK